jgi:YebC/PmpR family DNA-binding regulatory protein
MGRAFEKRKARKFARWGKVAKLFTRIGKEIAMAVKEGGPDTEYNPRLRLAIQNAKSVNMPKDTVEKSIKKASDKDAANYDEIVYEGYGPFGIAIVVECATDNTTRSVANVRSYFNKNNGSLGKTGSLDFLFERKGVFTINTEGVDDIDPEDLELQLIDYGAEEIEVDEDQHEIIIYTDYTDFGNMQKGIESVGLELKSAELERIPNTTTKLTEEQEAQIQKLLDKLEDDEDVQNVFHTMA